MHPLLRTEALPICTYAHHTLARFIQSLTLPQRTSHQCSTYGDPVTSKQHPSIRSIARSVLSLELVDVVETGVVDKAASSSGVPIWRSMRVPMWPTTNRWRRLRLLNLWETHPIDAVSAHSVNMTQPGAPACSCTRRVSYMALLSFTICMLISAHACECVLCRWV